MATKLIPTHNIEALKASFEKLIKKAKKLGVELPHIQILGTEFVQVDNHLQSFTKIQYQGTSPKLNGWSFVGLIENVNGAAIVKSAPGKEVPEHYRYSNPNHCDHCGIDRKRNNTFIVKSEIEYKQVGKSCLKDFLGHASPEQVAAYAAQLTSFSDDEYTEYSSESCHMYFAIKDVIVATHAAIAAYGFVRSSEVSSTKDTVISHFISRDFELNITQESIDAADECLSYMQNMGNATEFAHNVATISKSEYVKLDLFGYIVAGVNSAMKAAEAERVTHEKNYTSYSRKEIGAPNSKVQVIAKVLTATTFSRAAYHYYDNGVSQVLVLCTEENQLIKMFTSNMDIKVGMVVTIKGELMDTEVETFEKSPFRGATINRFKPRARLTLN